MVSIIVTVHNSEKYLRECLDSVCNQTYDNIEIICIDGGSTDSSPEILKEYSKNDARIRIINDFNTSYGHKVNRGILEAHGEYISVIESDDLYELGMLESIMAVFNKYKDLDFVNGNYRFFWDVNGIRHYVCQKMYKEHPYNQVIDNRGKNKLYEIMGRYWTGVYRKKFITDNDIRLNESPGASFQDMSVNFLFSVLSGKTYHLDSNVYKYRMDNNLSSIRDTSKILTIVYENEYLQNELVRRNITDEDIWSIRYRYKYMGFDGIIANLLPEGQEILYKKYIEELEHDIPLMPDYSVKKYPYTDIGYIKDKKRYLEVKKQQHYDIVNSNKSIIRFWSLLDEGNQFVIFGCGRRALRYMDYFKYSKKSLVAYADNDSKKWGNMMDNVVIYSLKEAVKLFPNACYVIANEINIREMHKQLEGEGITKDKIIDSL